MTRDTIDFWKRLGIISGAIAGSATIVFWLSAQAWGIATSPITAAIAAERLARERADDRIVDHLASISRDRLDLVDVMMTAPGKDRDRKLSLIREKWAAEEKHREARP